MAESTYKVADGEYAAREPVDDTSESAESTFHGGGDDIAEAREEPESEPAAIDTTEDVKETMSEAVEQVRETALHASDSVVQYIRAEPVKSVVIASAASAALVAIVSLLAGSRGR